jgi:LysM repeat protein
LAISRYITHVVVLVLALALAGYATLDRHLPAGLSLRLGAVNPEGLVIGEGGSAGPVEMGRAGTILQPVSIPTEPVAPHAPFKYEVQNGDTVQSLASRYGVSQESIRWSNLAAMPQLANFANDVRKGQTIWIPPVNGVAVIVQKGQTPQSLADAYHADVEDIMRFNYIRTSESDPLTPGTPLVIPGGRGPKLVEPAALRGRSLGNFGSYQALPIPWAGSTAGNPFPYGQCTWWAYHMKPVPWSGNAIEWYAQAQRYGWLVGRAARPGSIMVSAESYYGHVAYVESVNSDGSWTVSEMNYLGVGRVDQRTIHPPFAPLLGFIYGPPNG